MDSAAVHIHVSGEIDLATAPQLAAALLGEIAAAVPAMAIRVDLAGTQFIDAVGIGVLVRARETARRAGVGWSVHHPRGTVRLVIDILDIGEWLRVVPDETIER